MQNSNWEKCKLKSICKNICSGGTPKSTESSFYGGNIPWLRTQEVNFQNIYSTGINITNAGLEHSAAKWVPTNTVIVAMYGNSAGRSAITKIPLTTNQACCCFQIDERQADYRYVYNFLKLNYLRIKDMANGGAQQNLNSLILKNLDISLPPLDEQKRIADILGAFDDKIELLQKQNKTLEDMAKALFKSWFVDFDVVRAKQKGLPKADIVREYHLTEELYDLFPSSFADSPLGPIPSGWEVKPLSKIATFLNGLALQKYPARAEEDFLPVIKIAELRNGISTSTDKANTNLPTEYIVHNGDILFSWSGSLMVKVWSGEKGALNQHLFKVFSNGYPKWFYYLWVNHYLPMFQEIAADKATTMGHIQRKHLDQAKVVCPSAAFLDKMDKIFGVILSKIILNNKQIQTLTELRDSLLPRLISGKIRV